MSKPRFTKDKPAGGKEPRARAFVQVNISVQEQSELRALAKEFGMELRLFLRNAVHEHEVHYRSLLAAARQAGVSPETLMQWHCIPSVIVKN